MSYRWAPKMKVYSGMGKLHFDPIGIIRGSKTLDASQAACVRYGRDFGELEFPWLSRYDAIPFIRMCLRVISTLLRGQLMSRSRSSFHRTERSGPTMADSGRRARPAAGRSCPGASC
jgi:hypothetical protein